MRRYLILISVCVFLFVNPSLLCQGQDPGEVKKLLKKVEKQEYDTETVDALLQQASKYRANKPDSSILLSEIALELAQNLEYYEGIVDAYYKKSLTCKKNGDVKTAILFARKSLVLADSINDSLLIAKTNYHLANLINTQSEKPQALAHYMKALQIFMIRKDTLNLIAVYNGLGNYFLETGAYQSAAINYQQGLIYAIGINHEKYQGIIIGNLGKVYLRLNEFGLAEKYLFMALETAITFRDTLEQSNVINRLGESALNQNNFSNADSLFKLALSLKKQVNDLKGINNLWINLGILYSEPGRLQEAMINFDTAMAYYRKHDIAEGMIAAWQGKAYLYQKQNNFSKARIYYDSCLQLAVKSLDLSRLEQIYLSLYTVHEAQGDLTNALKYYRLYHTMGDSINSIEKNQMLYQLNLMGEKEKRALAEDIRKEGKNIQIHQRNTFTYTIAGLVVMAIFLIIFFRYRAKKNQIIAEQKVKQLEEEKKLLAVRFLFEGQEEERKRIATELHDGLGALLSVTKMQFTAIRDVSPENKPHLDKVAQFLEQASGDVRKISHNMMPGLLSKLGLCEALEDLFETINDTEGMDARLEVIGPRERLPENKEIMIYRIIQEIVNNSLKHAEANKIDLTIIVHPDQLDISCSDNGKGFERDEILLKKTIGIQSIHSRVRFLDGNICIDSSPGNGTVYRINIPLDNKED